MKKFSVSKTYSLPIDGAPASDLEVLEAPVRVALTPAAVPFCKPKLMVKEGDMVKIGTPLFFDKQDERIRFGSPGAGRVSRIVFGDRRAIEAVEIELASKEASESFDVSGIDKLKREKLIELLLSSGLWSLIRAFPFRGVANPDELVKSVFVNLDDLEPFQAKASVYLGGQEAAFESGIALLKSLCSKVVVSVGEGSDVLRLPFKKFVTHRASGGYPASDVGVVHYHGKKSEKDNPGWFVGGQDVIRLGEFALTGQLSTRLVVAVGGTKALEKKHYLTRLGVGVSHLLKGKEASAKKVRYIAGGVLTGRRSEFSGYLSCYESALNVIPEGQESEFVSFMQLGVKKPTYSRAYLAGILSRVFEKSGNGPRFVMNSAVQGSSRDCISCGHCAEVCPVDILPQFMMKNLMADDIEEGMRHGLMDCTSCGLCTYVCPSKIELGTIFDDAKKALYKEMNS